MKVRTLIAHSNMHGDAQDKEPGAVYEHPSPKTDIALGNVELVQVKASK